MPLVARLPCVQVGKLDVFLSSETGSTYVKGVARLLTEHLHRLGRVKDLPRRATAAGGKAVSRAIRVGSTAAVLRVGTGTVNHFPGPPGSPMSPARVATAAALAPPGTPLAAAAVAGDFQVRLCPLILSLPPPPHPRALYCVWCGVTSRWCLRTWRRRRSREKRCVTIAFVCVERGG